MKGHEISSTLLHCRTPFSRTLNFGDMRSSATMKVKLLDLDPDEP